MIKEYLIQEGAVGAENAITTQALMCAFHMTDRKVIAVVADERKNGALICERRSEGGGYYMPATDEEILKQKARFEKGFVSRAYALRPFRAWAKAHKE
jgi:hypothetical protein